MLVIDSYFSILLNKNIEKHHFIANIVIIIENNSKKTPIIRKIIGVFIDLLVKTSYSLTNC